MPGQREQTTRGGWGMDDFEIRKVTFYSEFEQLIKLQKIVWGHQDIDITPIHQFNVSSRTGAILLGAFLKKLMVGFIYSFPAVYNGSIAQHSHQLAVLPEFRGQKIGKKLKWAQRDTARKMGFDLVAWTTDPLIARNANLNIHTLGAVAKKYFPDYYQEIQALSLAPSIPMDRLLMEWPLASSCVEERSRRESDVKSLAELPRALKAKEFNDEIPDAPDLSLTDECLLAEIPRNIHTMAINRIDNVLEWRMALRSVMLHYFSLGYAAVDFIFAEHSYFILQKKGCAAHSGSGQFSAMP